jgi:hypothetical protein
MPALPFRDGRKMKLQLESLEDELLSHTPS